MKQALPKIMQAVAMDRFGGIEMLTLRTLPVLEIGPDEVLIRVESAGVGVWDPYEREGGFAKIFGIEPRFPYVLGSDGAGTVMALGERVNRFKEGDRVYAMSVVNPKGGFYAEFTAVRADHVSPVPRGLSTEQAGAMPVCAITALRGLDDALHLKESESVMVVGASGGIGHLAVQLAKRMRARVLAVASGEDGVALAKKLGADAVADGHRDDLVAAARDFAPGGLDAALLTSGGEPVQRSLAAMRSGGRIAFPNGVEPEPQAQPGLTITAYDGMTDQETLGKLNRLIEAGSFEVHIARAFPLAQAADAHRALDSHYLGKLVLHPGNGERR